MLKYTVVVIALLLWALGIGVSDNDASGLFSVYLPPVAWWNALCKIWEILSLMF